MTISTKRASQLRLGIRWAYRDMETRKLNGRLAASGRQYRLPLIGMNQVRAQSRATVRAYHRVFTILLVREVHGIFQQLRPHVGDDIIDGLEKYTGLDKGPQGR